MKFLSKTIYDNQHEEFCRSFRYWLDTSVAPHHEDWDRLGIGPRLIWLETGQHGFLGLTVPKEFGGGGTDDYRFAAVISEEIGATGLIGVPHGFTLHNDIVLPYLLKLCGDEQKMRWLPKTVTGETITALAFTQPNTGSDVAGIKSTVLKTLVSIF